MAGRDNARNLAQPTNTNIWALVIGIGFLLALSVGYSFCRWVGVTVRGEDVAVTWHPLLAFLEVLMGNAAWGRAETVTACALAVLVGLVVALIVAFKRNGAPKKRARNTPKTQRTRIDSRTKYLASKKDVASLSVERARETAERLHGEEMAKDYPGLRFGHEVATGQPLYSGWEDLQLIMAGPRQGKTTSSVIPAILDAPGCVVTTSNKPDIVADTIKVTEHRGTAWVFDPQGLTKLGARDWFYDPLSYIRSDKDNLDAAAGALASLFAGPFMREGGDNYFPSAARNLLTGMLLAAAITERPISDVLLWTNNERDKTPINILAEVGGQDYWVKMLTGLYQLTDKTRSGVFGQAQNMVSVFARAEVRKWVEKTPGRVEFVPEQFVREKADTLYLLSKEGPRSVGVLTTVLTVAVMQAAESYGEEQKNGRLPVPLVCPLDEMANTVIWEELPAVVSHYGSRGIIILGYLQSFSQGIGVWGQEKMEALWSAMTIKLIGPGLSDEQVTKRVSDLVGVHEEYQRSASRGSGGDSSTQRSVHEKQTLTSSEVAEIPPGRWLVFSVGRRPMIAAMEPFYKRKFDKQTTELMAK